MNSWKSILLGACAPILLAACATVPAPPPAAPQVAPPPAVEAPKPKPKFGTFGFDVAGMDTAVAPGDDFFAHANGEWVKTTEIPADRGNATTFTALIEAAGVRTRAIIEDTAKAQAPEGSDARKIGDYYASFMDQAAIEAAGLQPLKPELDRIAAIKTRADLSRELGEGLRADVDALNATDFQTDRLFGLWVAEDMNDTSTYRPYLMQGGLWMPDREYYLGDTPRFKDLRAKYQDHIAKMLTLAGYDDASRRAARVLALETAMAKAHWSVDATSDVAKANTVWTRAELATRAPGLDWTAYLTAAGLADQPRFGAWQASAISGLAKLVGDQPITAWKDYLAFHAVERGAPYMGQALVDEHFAFNGTALSGTPQQRERWKRGVDNTSLALGEAVGKIYAERHFSPDAKAQVQGMVKNLLVAFDARVDRLDWMSPQTKARAKEKLANFRVGVGYPDKWRDYSALRIVRGDAYGNWERGSLFEYRRNVAKLGRPVDRDEWYLLPQDVNALNMPMQNMIIFPAAILEPTFFDPNADAAVNYGAIGGVIGHEIVHGFDDIGALFDPKGNLRNWWTPADMAQFKARGAALARQYSTYEPLPGLHLNGEQVLGENIADLAGLATAYDAYHLSLRGAAAPVIDGFTADQRFYFGWAQNYRSKYREAALRRAVLTGVHSPGMYRAQTVRNQDPWYGAFDVKADQGLYLAPADRVKIW
ncbi:M13 family metallopeptidase [Phenylobacterium sp. LH3H17]|uniref:M13 family metallopeptidase n=1 Tax=Phenylobacterium sp. LH3H17 TaxID=2903901 RepID=UPI0020CA1069|nr:M13 family metallopeptidase [Phenylobacterium sp. LH3H17]UTP41245.1 M13 family metallopeptidase [Phenylobacterium sp. LH3H17]